MKSTTSNELDYYNVSNKILDEIHQIVEQLKLNNAQAAMNKGALENLRKSISEVKLDLRSGLEDTVDCGS